MLFRTYRLKTVLQAGTMLLAAAYTVLLIYHNKGVTQASRPVDVRWQERGPRSVPGDYDSNSIDSYNDSMLVKGEISRESETSTRTYSTNSEFGTVASVQLMNTTLDDIFISVKTTRSYHKWRLPVILKTWFQLAQNQTWFFTDSDDSEFQQKTNGHMINTNCSSSHNRKALCCKMSVEFDVFLDSNKKWFCHFDDDNYVNVPRLVKMLRGYNSQQDWYLGKPSIRAPLEIIAKDNTAQKISFWFATGGAGFCLSRALALKMMPVASGGKFISVGEKIRLPDDVTMGYIIEHLLRKHLTVVEQFHSHLEPMKFLRRDSLHDQISLSYSRYGKDDLNVVKIEGLDYKLDPTRFLSLHCFLFPHFKFCPRLTGKTSECRMNEQILQDWLAEYSALSPVEVSSFATTLINNVELNEALYNVFENYTKCCNLIQPISKQLFNFYRSKHHELKLFTLQFLPNLIYIYLSSVAQGDKKSVSGVETLLIGIYNLEVVDETGKPTIISFRLPSLAQASIYHEPMSLAHASLTETALRRLEECNTKLISWGPHPQVETLNAQNRLKTLTGLIFIYNRHIGDLNKISLKYLCGVSSLLAMQGFEKSPSKLQENQEGLKYEQLPRIPVSSQFFLELLCGLYYAMYNDFGYEAMKAVLDIYKRSCLECYADVIIVANAIKNSSQVSSKGHPREGPMGISVALTPSTTTVSTVNKFMITNASFRTKKLPDDIPIIPKDESSAGSDGAKPLAAITEEKEDAGFSVRGNSFRGKEAMAKNLQKLNICKKLKDKEGKSSSKTNLTSYPSCEKKQSTSLQFSTLIEKVSLKSPVIQNGDFAQTEGDGHSSLASGRKKIVGTDAFADTSKDGVCQEVSNKSNSGFASENQSSLTSYILDNSSSNDEVVHLFSSNKAVEDKPLMQISSV